MARKKCKEVWLPVPGYEGIYEVSNFGKVRSVTRKVTDRLGRTRTITGQIKKTWIDNGGYERVELCKFDTRVGWGLHRVVAMAFKPGYNEEQEVMHLDHNKLNNHSDNLEWGTHTENIQSTISAGRYRNGNMMKTQCPKGHPYSGLDSRGTRICHVCRAEQQRRYHARKKGQTM